MIAQHVPAAARQIAQGKAMFVDNSKIVSKFKAGHFNHVPPALAVLIAEFGCEINEHAARQVIGRMVKQIMEARG
jgi:hypothetical protein